MCCILVQIVQLEANFIPGVDGNAIRLSFCLYNLVLHLAVE